MEIVKTNENYSISETLENGWKMSGNASHEINGSLNVWFNITVEDGLSGEIAHCTYNKYENSDKINLSLSVSEANRDEVTTYFDKVIDSILEHFNSL